LPLKERVKRYIPDPLLRLKWRAHRHAEQRQIRRRPPVILHETSGQPARAEQTLAIVCGPHFNQSAPNAMTKHRSGMAAGFQELGIPCRYLSFLELHKLRELHNPIVFIQELDYEFLSGRQVNELRKHRKFVWVDPWLEDVKSFVGPYEFVGTSLSDKTKEKVLRSEPAFVFTIAPEIGLEYYEGWRRRGVALVSLPLACDTQLYGRSDEPKTFEDVRIAFVGGYWPYKAKSFDLYLKPYEKLLTVYGYWSWPYAGYGGRLPDEDEPRLYRDAALSPAINEPHVSVMGIDLNERVFKVLGSGGLCVTDVTPAYSCLFAPDELLIPRDLDQYHDMVQSVMKDPPAFSSYRESGYKAVRARHTYKHRAEQVLQLLRQS
jgi:hypothetical protein